MLAQLIPVSGGATVTIDRDVTVVGRLEEHCDLVLERKSVSKLHCIIVKTDGLLFVRDLSSTNGTKVNGQKIIRGALLPGDQLSFAGEKFVVHMGPSPLVSPHQQTQVLESSPSFAAIDEESASLSASASADPDDPDLSVEDEDLRE